MVPYGTPDLSKESGDNLGPFPAFFLQGIHASTSEVHLWYQFQKQPSVVYAVKRFGKINENDMYYRYNLESMPNHGLSQAIVLSKSVLF